MAAIEELDSCIKKMREAVKAARETRNELAEYMKWKQEQ